jgi:sodium/potassium/calcium exchanger 6
MQRTLIKALVIGVTFLFFIVSNDGITGVKQQQPLRSKALLSLDRIVATKTDVGTNNTIPAGEDFPSQACVDINLHEDRCEYVRQMCSKTEGFVNYLELHYCTFQDKAWLSLSVLLILMLLYFYMLGSTAERFFCPALARVSEGLNLSPNVAGVTLLALGNGSPDIFAQVAAANNGVFSTAMGTMLGSSLFVCTVVVGLITLVSKSAVTVTRRPFIRDVLFFMISVVFLFLVCWDNKIYVWESASLIGLYFSYVLVVVIARIIYQRSKKRRKLEKRENTTASLIDNDSLRDSEDGLIIEDEDAEKREVDRMINGDVTDSIEEENEEIQSIDTRSAELDARRRRRTLAARFFRKLEYGVSYFAKTGVFMKKKKKHVVDDAHQFNVNGSDSQYYEDVHYKKRTWPEKFHDYFHTLGEYFDWFEQGPKNRILTIIDSPRLLAQHLTIHYSESDKYFRTFYVLQPICIPLFFFIVFDAWSFSWLVPGPFWIWILGVAGLLSLVVFLTTVDYKPPPYEWGFIVCGMLMAIVWIYLIAAELVGIITAMGLILGISNAIMGLTIIAWGNSVGDSVSNVIVSRKGHPQMAIAACTAAPLTNLLLGQGISNLLLALKRGGVILLENTAGEKVLTNNMFLAFLFLMITLLLNITLIPLFKFQFKKQFGVLLVANYAAFTILSFLTEFGFLFDREIWFEH